MLWPDSLYDVCGIVSDVESSKDRTENALEIIHLFSEDEQVFLLDFYRAGLSKADITRKYDVSLNYLCMLLTGKLNEIVYSNVEYYNLLKFGKRTQDKSKVPSLNDSALFLFPDIHVGRCIQRAGCRTIVDVAKAFYYGEFRKQRGVGPLILTVIKARLQLLHGDLVNIPLFTFGDDVIAMRKYYTLVYAFSIANDGQPLLYFEKRFCKRCGKVGVITIEDLTHLSIVDGDVTFGHAVELSEKLQIFFNKTKCAAEDMSIVDAFQSKRIIRVLLNNNFKTLGDIKTAYENDSLRYIDEIGRSSLDQIKHTLAHNGLITIRRRRKNENMAK